jgi:thiol-disulfide isomerase/thioredoxin
MRKLLLGFVDDGDGGIHVAPVHASTEPTKAINFEFVDVEWQKVTKLSDFKGKWVLVNFWAPWCPLCWVEVPTLNELNKRKDFVVIGSRTRLRPDANVVKETASATASNFMPWSPAARAAMPGQPVPSGRPGRFLSDFLHLRSGWRDCDVHSRSGQNEQDSCVHG